MLRVDVLDFNRHTLWRSTGGITVAMDPELIAAASAVAGVTLQEAIGFVRDQLALILQRRRIEAQNIDSELLDAPLRTVVADVSLAERERQRLEELIDVTRHPGDSDRAGFEELRRCLESILGQHVTFRGEDRPATGSPTAPAHVEGQRIFHVNGERNVIIAGDHHGSISL